MPNLKDTAEFCQRGRKVARVVWGQPFFDFCISFVVRGGGGEGGSLYFHRNASIFAKFFLGKPTFSPYSIATTSIFIFFLQFSYRKRFIFSLFHAN